MEKLKIAMNQITYAPCVSNLPSLHRSMVPLLTLTSSLYLIALRLRYRLYEYGLSQQHRLSVPVISLGNLTWGGNGKTPMVEFLASLFADSGIPPLILTRGYAGGDEAIMLRRHLEGTSAKIGVGANRAETAIAFLKKFGVANFDRGMCINRSKAEQREMSVLVSGGIGVAILDDGMQHLSLWRDLDIVMVNATMPWGNHCLIPLGPLREPLTALKRADIMVIHHADLVYESHLCLYRLLQLPFYYPLSASNYQLGITPTLAALLASIASNSHLQPPIPKILKSILISCVCCIVIYVGRVLAF